MLQKLFQPSDVNKNCTDDTSGVTLDNKLKKICGHQGN